MNKDEVEVADAGDDDDDEDGSDGASSTTSESRGRGRGRGRGGRRRRRKERGRGGREEERTSRADRRSRDGAPRRGHERSASARGGRGGRLAHAPSRQQIPSLFDMEKQLHSQHCLYPSQSTPAPGYGVPPPQNHSQQPPYTPQSQQPYNCYQPYNMQQPYVPQQPYQTQPPNNFQQPYNPLQPYNTQQPYNAQQPHNPQQPYLPQQPSNAQQPYNAHQPYNTQQLYIQPAQPASYGSSLPHHYNQPQYGLEQHQPPPIRPPMFETSHSRQEGLLPTPLDQRPGQLFSANNQPGRPRGRQQGPMKAFYNRREQSTPRPESGSGASANVDLGADQWVKVFQLLLKEFNGRTKLATLMRHSSQIFKGVSHQQAAQWIRQNPNRFLTFEKDETIRYVSVFFLNSRLCYNYTKPNTEVCKENCRYFHVCKDYINGSCTRGAKCGFNHSFHAKANGKICTSSGLGMFTDEEIRLISIRSIPVVCEKYNKGGCGQDTCPDLHVCARYVLRDCPDGDTCKLGHSFKDTEHNKWVLDAFRMGDRTENVLRKAVVVPKDKLQGTTPSKTPSGNDTEAAEASAKTSKPRKKSGAAARRAVSQENLLQDTEEPTVSGEETKEADGKPENSSSLPRLGSDKARKLWVLEQQKAANAEGEDGRNTQTAGQYTHLCEYHTWLGKCPRGYLCPRYHHRQRPPFMWQVEVLGDWKDLQTQDSYDIEKRFCALASEGRFEIILDISTSGFLKLSVHFDTMTATLKDTYAHLRTGETLRLRRWSTPSYTEADRGTPLNYYTQWCWYYAERDGQLLPYCPSAGPGLFQYTLEEKFCSGQKKYYCELEGRQVKIHLQDMVQVDPNTRQAVSIYRRPVFFEKSASVPHMSPLLSSSLPSHPNRSASPDNWFKAIDLFQEFELVELEELENDYKSVSRTFHATLDRSKVFISNIFRVQNLSLWDRYCSTKRSMVPRDGSMADVDERLLFHGTPSLQAARGICTNSLDFRMSGQNVGALFGRGSYFSTHALYSHNYTGKGPVRYMFLAKVLVGKYTLGQQAYVKPPVREGLKLYDSCVDNEDNPTIFVIFDLAQSYPEYLIQYKDGGAHAQGASPLQKRAEECKIS